MSLRCAGVLAVVLANLFFFKVSAITAQDTPTCKALQEIAAKPADDKINCETNEKCDGLVCSAAVFENQPPFTTEINLYPCTSPPALHFVIERSAGEGSEYSFEDMVDESRSITLFDAVIEITINSGEDTIGVEVVAENVGLNKNETLTVIEYTVIPLDTSECGITPTCKAIMELTDMTDIEEASCTVNEACDGVDCIVELTIIGASFTALTSAVINPCSKPPSVTISIASADDGKIFYRVTLSESTEIVDIPTVVINVTIVQYNDSVGFELEVIPEDDDSGFGSGSGDFVPEGVLLEFPYSEIPINTSACTEPDVQGAGVGVHATSLLTTIVALVVSILHYTLPQ